MSFACGRSVAIALGNGNLDALHGNDEWKWQQRIEAPRGSGSWHWPMEAAHGSGAVKYGILMESFKFQLF